MEDTLVIERPPLNEGQQLAHDYTVSYVQGERKARIMMIKGYAGTGKTFTINRIVETLMKWSDSQTKWENKLNIVASAPTHKAVRVMRKNSEMGSRVQYSTIHSLLGLRPDVDYKTGVRSFKPSTNPEDGRIQEFNVVIVDETSMLGKDLWEPLMEEVEKGNIKLILLGDPVQIPPVNELDSPPFVKSQEYGIEVVELTQSMRQAGNNPILDYATAIRGVYKNSIVDPVLFYRINEKDHGIVLIPGVDVQRIDQILEDRFGSDKFKADADYMKVIAWRNDTVDAFNKKIRRMLYAVPEGLLALPMLVNGEKLILDERYTVPNANNFALPTNEELEVLSYNIVRKGIQYQLWSPMGGMSTRSLNPQIYQTTVRYRSVRDVWNSVVIEVVHEASRAEVESMLKDIEKSAKSTSFGTQERREMWKHFYHMRDLFAKVKYNYAVTAHKSQGSTYENCMLVQWDIGYNRKLEERNRITYVGATRAKSLLYIIT